MNTYTFVKEDGTWKVESPGYVERGGSAADLQMALGAETMLNLLSGGSGRVTLALNREPFEDAEELELLQPCSPFLDGGYYQLRQFAGREINCRMWVCDVTRFAFGEHPARVYVRKVDDGR